MSKKSIKAKMKTDDKFKSFILRERWNIEKENLDPGVIFDSIKNQMDSLKAVSKWFILLGFTTFFSLIKGDSIKILNVVFAKSELTPVFILINVSFALTFFILFQRLGDLFLLLKRENFIEGISELSVHSWIFNPFSHFGGAGMSRIHESIGYGGIIFLWFLLTAPIIWTNDSLLGNYLIIPLFVILIFSIRYSMGRVIKILDFRLIEIDKKRYQERVRTLRYRKVIYRLFLVAGLLVWSIPLLRFLI